MGGSPTASAYSPSWSISLTRPTASVTAHRTRILCLTFSYAPRRALIPAFRAESSAPTTRFFSPQFSSLRRPNSSSILNISSWRSSTSFPTSWSCSSRAVGSPQRTFFSAHRGWFRRGCLGHQPAPSLSLRCTSHLSSKHGLQCMAAWGVVKGSPLRASSFVWQWWWE